MGDLLAVGTYGLVVWALVWGWRGDRADRDERSIAEFERAQEALR